MIRLAQIAPAIIMAGLSALVIIETRHLSYWNDYAPGAAFAPWWIAACGLVLSGLLVIHTLRNPPGETPEDSRTSLTGFYRAAATFGTLVGFLALIPSLGLVLASMLTAAVIMLLILRREILPSAASTLAAGGLIYGIFVWWLQIPLPKGPLGF